MDAISYPDLNKQEVIQSYFSSKEILQQLIIQIAKDFHTSGFEIKLDESKEFSFKELVDVVHEKLLDLNPEQIFSLSYKIDIPENRTSDKGENSHGVSLEKISELIVKRELQKIILREIFKKPS